MKTILNNILSISLLLVFSFSFGQAKKPSLLIVPSDNWCFQNGAFDIIDNQGTELKVPNYKKAVQENSDLLIAVSKLEEMLQLRGFPPKNLEQTLKSLEMQQTRNNQVTSFDSGSSIALSPQDELNSVAKADILIQFTWTVNKVGPQTSLTYILSGFDAYTNKPVGNSAGTGPNSLSSPIATLVEQAVTDKMDGFLNLMQMHFDDMFTNGREVIVEVRTWDDWGYSLMDYFGEEEEELGILIEDWLADNTVEGRFNTADYTDTSMLFEQVRIPLFTERNGRQRALDTRSFVSNLRRHLKSDFQIDAKVDMQGLGKAILTIGGK
jgi:hypothetical protein